MSASFPKRIVGRGIRRSKSLANHLVRRGRNLVHLGRGRYDTLDINQGLCYQQVRSPLTEIDLTTSPILHTMDFLPDRWSFSGKDFAHCPHVTFAKAYLAGRGEKTNAPFDYRNTDYFQLALTGRLPFPCHGSRDAHMRCQQFIYLINQIEQQGYQPDQYGAISFVHTTQGKYMVVNGKHRLAALLALNYQTAKVFMGFDNEIRAQFRKIAQHAWPICAYRKSFQALEQLGEPNDANAQAIASLIAHIKKAKLETWADIYHPLPFYEFRHLSTQVQPQTPYQRLQMILNATGPIQGKRVLDLGCNLGFYSLSLAKRGADVTGVELREDYQNISRQISKLYNVPVQWKQTSLTPDLIDEVGKVDVTLCFSMIQWVIDQQGMDTGEQILRKISEQSNMLLFDVSVNEGKAHLTTQLGEELWYVDQWLHKATTYPNIKCVGQVHPYDTDTRYVFCCSHTR